MRCYTGWVYLFFHTLLNACEPARVYIGSSGQVIILLFVTNDEEKRHSQTTAASGRWIGGERDDSGIFIEAISLPVNRQGCPFHIVGKSS